MKRIYFDHNATTPVHPLVMENLSKWAQQWGNASSVHQMSRDPKVFIREARKNFAALLSAHPLELIFTSGGSESNNTAIKGVYNYLNTIQIKTGQKQRNHYLVTQVEHPSVLESFEYLQRQGAKVDFIPVNTNGVIDLDLFQSKVRSDTAMVSCMLANNETGHLFPIKKMTKIAHEKGVIFHCDAVQGLGKLNINIKDLDVDLASFSGHKFYALKGAGVLYIKSGTRIENLIHGGGQERHRRAGTENVLAIASLGLVASFKDQISEYYEKTLALRNYLEDQVSKIAGVFVYGREDKRLPNTSNIRIEGCDGETLLMNLDIEGICVSTGAACSSGSQEPSPVLRAMGWTRQEAQNSLRISLGWMNTKEEVDFFIEKLNKVTLRIRSFSTT